jgi:Family of unknown function (DUF6029)
VSTLRFAVLATIIITISLSAGVSSAQDMYIQGSNEMRWADGREVFGGDDVVKRYFEDRLNLNMYYGDIRIGTRFTMLQPSEFGEYQTDINTLEKRFLEYSANDIYFRVGNLYTVWGRGLGLALIEDIIQGFDSGLDGMHGRVGFRNIEVDALSGRSKAGFLGQVREAKVSAGQITHYHSWGTNIGAQVMMVTPVEDEIQSYPESRTFAGHFAWDGSSTSIWTEYAYEDIEGVKRTNDAFYASGSWFGGNASLFADYKRYQYFKYAGGAAGGGGYAQSVDILPFHSAPIVQREFTSPLFSKHPHIVRFDNEVGFQIEGSYNIAGSNTVSLNYSQSSSFIENDLVMPSLDEVDSPYRQVFAEYTGYVTNEFYLTAWGGWDEDLVYTIEGGGAVQARTSWLRRNVAGLGGEYQLADDWSLKGQFEAGLVEDVDAEDTSVESITILGLTWRQQFSFSAALETAENDPNQDKTSWLKGEFSAFIDNRHELLVTVGEERGGLVCTSGKCRVVAPFEGVKVTLTSIF